MRLIFILVLFSTNINNATSESKIFRAANNDILWDKIIYYQLAEFLLQGILSTVWF